MPQASATSQPVKYSLLALVGLCFSIVLLFHDLTLQISPNSGPSFCAISPAFDCDVIAKSDYARILGVPVSSFAAAFYLFMLFCVWQFQRDRAAAVRAMLLLSAASLGPTFFELGVSVFILKTICLMCAVLYATNLSLFLFAVLEARKTGFSAVLRDGLRDLSEGINGVLRLRRRPMAFLGVIILLSIAAVTVPAQALHLLRASRPTSEEALFRIWEQSRVEPINLAEGDDSRRELVLGDRTAPITLVVFSDFECPYCRRAAKMLAPVLQRHKSSVRLIFKNFPLDSSCNPQIGQTKHEFACRLARMVRCADEQNKFPQMHDALFDLDSLDDETIDVVPIELMLDPAAFRLCMVNPATEERIKEDIKEGERLKISGTPTLFIEGRKIAPTPQGDWISVIDRLARAAEEKRQ